MRLTADKRVLASETESREYKIEGSPDQLDELEVFFDWMSKLSSWGHSAKAEVYVDGDGAANIRVDGLKMNMEEQEDYKEQEDPELTIGIGV